jgi:Domain of unknown function (DU1801)
VAENKTKPTKVSVAEFLKKKASGQQLADSRVLVKLFKEVTGKPAKMWGPSIVGFGSYHYVYESGHAGDAPLLGFSPRKPDLVIYLAPGLADKGLKEKLGKHKGGAGCLYVRKLEDLDLAVLRKLAQASVKTLRERYPRE